MQATYVSGSGTSSCSFAYTILAGQTDVNGISFGANALSLNSGSIKNAAGNNVTITSSAVTDNASYLVDTTAPTTTIATAVFSADTGNSSDFITKTAVQTISGRLSAVLATGETVYVSIDNGTTWTAATTTVGADTWNLASQTLTGSSTLQVKVTDLAGNDGAVYSHAYVLDSTAPTVTITPSTTSLASNGTETVTFAFSEAVSGFELGDITASNGTFSALTPVVSSNSYTATFTASTIGSSVFGVSAGSYTDVAGNLGAAGSSESVTVTPTISLGAGMGDLTDPVTVLGNNYYFWDKSGNGTSGTEDKIDLTNLITLFAHGINDAPNATAGSVIDDTHHYAWINGVHLSLPTLGESGGATTMGNMPGTAATTNSTSNSTYSDLLAIWDSQNGNTSNASINETNISGTPLGWQVGDYWSATPTTSSAHAYVYLGAGYVSANGDGGSLYVALQVL